MSNLAFAPAARLVATPFVVAYHAVVQSSALLSLHEDYQDAEEARDNDATLVVIAITQQIADQGYVSSNSPTVSSISGAPVVCTSVEYTAYLDALSVLDNLSYFVSRRAGFEPANYSTRSSLDSARRASSKDRSDALRLIDYVRTSLSFPEIGARIIKSLVAGRERLSMTPLTCELSYCAGQSYPDEVRASVASAVAGALWKHWAEESEGRGAETVRLIAYNVFGRRIQKAYFN